MDRRKFGFVAATACIWPRFVLAQAAAKIARFGWLSAGTAEVDASLLLGLRRGLKDLGYAEGKTYRLEQMYQRLAVYIDRILKGANPGDLPLEQPTKFELAINLKAAKAIGLVVPRSLLLRAEHIVQ